MYFIHSSAYSDSWVDFFCQNKGVFGDLWHKNHSYEDHTSK